MEDLSLHILDIAENSLDAGADRIEILLAERPDANRLTLEVRDNGRGMDAETVRKLTDPFFTTKSVRRFGLGIPLLAQAAEECNGAFRVVSAPGAGTTITAEFELNHLDLKPFGDMGATLMTLIGGHPEIRFVFRYVREGGPGRVDYTFDTLAFAELLDGVPITLPDVLQLVRDDINARIKEGPAG